MTNGTPTPGASTKKSIDVHIDEAGAPAKIGLLGLLGTAVYAIGGTSVKGGVIANNISRIADKWPGAPFEVPLYAVAGLLGWNNKIKAVINTAVLGFGWKIGEYMLSSSGADVFEYARQGGVVFAKALGAAAVVKGGRYVLSKIRA